MKQLSKQGIDVTVGVFVVLGIAAIIGATLWAREAKPGSDRSIVVARFRDIGSAGVGTNAYLRGVRAGRVAGIELGDDGWVRVRIALDPTVRVPADPVVVLGAASLVGEWQATISSRDAAPDDPDVRRQLNEAAGERSVVPGATMPNVRQFAAGAGRILDDIGAVAGHARTAFDDSAALELREAIATARVLTATVAAAGEAVLRTALRIDSASARGQLPRTLEDAAAASAAVRAAAADLRLVTAGAADTRAVLDRVLARVDTLAAGAASGRGTMGRLMGDPALYAGADSLVRELRALVADIKANPRRYLNIRVF